MNWLVFVVCMLTIGGLLGVLFLTMMFAEKIEERFGISSTVTYLTIWVTVLSLVVGAFFEVPS